LLSVSAGAKADVFIYTDRTAFLAALSQPGTDTFNNMPGTELPTPQSRTTDVGASYSYQAAAGPTSDFFPAGTAADRWLATNTSDDTITFSNFAPGVQGFGGNFFGTDVSGAFSAGHTVVLTGTDGTVTRTQNVTDATLTSFVGFVSNGAPLTSVTLHNDGTGAVYWATANDVTLAVPEPATYGMMLAGVGLLGFMIRRRAR
jgi:hypothetical protein